MTGFALSLDDLAVLADRDLPELAGLLSAPSGVLRTVNSLGPTAGDTTTAAVHSAYVTHIDALSAGQQRLCDAIVETAETLREIIGLYRRADGQQ